MKRIFNVPGESATALLLGIISGYPIGAKMVCNLKKQKIISKIEAERLIAYTNNSSLLFILGSVGIALFSSHHIGIILLLSHLISCLLVGFIFRNWKKNNLNIDYKLFNTQEQKLVKLSDLGEIIGTSIKNVALSVGIGIKKVIEVIPGFIKIVAEKTCIKLAVDFCVSKIAGLFNKSNK